MKTEKFSSETTGTALCFRLAEDLTRSTNLNWKVIRSKQISGSFSDKILYKYRIMVETRDSPRSLTFGPFSSHGATQNLAMISDLLTILGMQKK